MKYRQIPSSEVDALEDMKRREKLRICILLTQLKNMGISRARAKLIIREEYPTHSFFERVYNEVFQQVYPRGS